MPSVHWPTLTKAAAALTMGGGRGAVGARAEDRPTLNPYRIEDFLTRNLPSHLYYDDQG